MLKNGDFMSGWDDMPPTPSHLINQQPKHWTLSIIDIGDNLYGSGDKAAGTPECVHKLASQLPPQEQLGANNALILAGDTTYKIFSANAAFGTELKQTVTGLAPGTQGTLKAPVLAVLHGTGDQYAAESGVWVDTTGSSDQDDWEGSWANAGMMGDRKWYTHDVSFTVPASGQVTVYIRVKSKWPAPIDFFIDGITMSATAGAETASTEPKPTTNNKPAPRVVQITAPEGLTIVTQAGTEADTVIVTCPPGVEIEIL